ncbi:MAG: DNA recombination protein RmuC, partial [Bacteroidota bacterium]|nr:DNA recombination protein RmuC [Bacteroidota bacterium]
MAHQINNGCFMDPLYTIISVIIGLGLGGLIAYLSLKSKFSGSVSPDDYGKVNAALNQALLEKAKIEQTSKMQADELANLKQDYQYLQETAKLAGEEKAALKVTLFSQKELYQNFKTDTEKQFNVIKQENKLFKDEAEKFRLSTSEFSVENASLKNENKNLLLQIEAQNNELSNLQTKLSVEFKNLANEILEEKSSKFTEQNKANIDEILKPLNEKIKDFENKVNETYDKESKERFSLEREIKSLFELNRQMTKDAQNLTNAIKGQSKFQGNWGEFILESILEKSGLIKGEMFETQPSFTDETGKRFQPDAIVNLPGNKCIIVDSKVSLTDFERYCSAENEEEKQQYLKAHITSIRNHIANLSGKAYQNISQIHTLDYVILFINLEPAFNLAFQNDSKLYSDAMEKNIIIVSPTTLLAVLKTIAHIWQSDKQNKNVLIIAQEAGKMYDKFVLLLNDLIDVGKKIDALHTSHDKAMNKLYNGSGNLVKRAEVIKLLGAKTTRQMPQEMQ